METLAELAHRYRMSKARLDVIPSEIEAINNGADEVDLDSWFSENGNQALIKEQSAKIASLTSEKGIIENSVLPALKVGIEKALVEIKEANLTKLETERKALESDLEAKNKALDELLDQVLETGIAIYGTTITDRVAEQIRRKVSKYLQTNRKAVETDMGLAFRVKHFDGKLAKATNSNEILSQYFDKTMLASFMNTAIKEIKVEIVAKDEAEIRPDETKIDPYYDPEYAETVQSGMTDLMN